MFYIMHHHTFIVQRSRSVHRTVKPIINQSMKQQVPRGYILINEAILQIRKINMFILSQTDSKPMLFHDSVSNTEVTWRELQTSRKDGVMAFCNVLPWCSSEGLKEIMKTSVCVLAEIRGCYRRNRIEGPRSWSQFAGLCVTGRPNMAQLRPTQLKCAVAKKLIAWKRWGHSLIILPKPKLTAKYVLKLHKMSVDVLGHFQ
jgi:hypothetical protein